MLCCNGSNVFLIFSAGARHSAAALEAIVPQSNMNAVFLVDQLIFCEEQEK